PDRMLGAPRWTSASADVLFDKPPERVSTSGGGAVRVVLQGMADAMPGQQLAMLESDADRQRAAQAHARWDETASARIIDWLALAQRDSSSYRRLLAERLTESPNDVVLLRETEDGTGPERDSACVRIRVRADAAPDDPDLHYLADR